MTSLKESQLFDSFQDKEYRDIYVDELVGQGLAYQLRALRDKYGWTQEELGNRAGKKQEVISQLEDPDYGSYTLKTLKNLASAFDVALQVNFVSFRDLIRRTANLTPDIIAPMGYEEERQLSFAEVPGTSRHWQINPGEGLVTDTGADTGVGQLIYDTFPDDLIGLSGVSMDAPVLAGVAALAGFGTIGSSIGTADTRTIVRQKEQSVEAA